jgi:hypothetical protein
MNKTMLMGLMFIATTVFAEEPRCILEYTYNLNYGEGKNLSCEIFEDGSVVTKKWRGYLGKDTAPETQTEIVWEGIQDWKELKRKIELSKAGDGYGESAEHSGTFYHYKAYDSSDKGVTLLYRFAGNRQRNSTLESEQLMKFIDVNCETVPRD